MYDTKMRAWAGLVCRQRFLGSPHGAASVFSSLAAAACFLFIVSALTVLGDTPQQSDLVTANQPNVPRLERARLYGGVHEFAYYFVDILVGTPPQRQAVILDSGSSLLGFPCKRCKDCGSHLDSPFDFSISKTASWLPCFDENCVSGCGTENRCKYSQRYSEGSSIAGHYFTDLLALGDIQRQNEFVWFNHIGCHNHETNLFTTQKANGIMGVSFPRKGRTPTIIDALFGASDVNTRVFAICIADDGGEMTVGGFNSQLHRPSASTFSPRGMAAVADKQRRLLEFQVFRNLTDAGGFEGEAVKQVGDTSSAVDIAWTAITSSDAYSVGISQLTLDGEVLGKNFNRAIVDSGTTFTYFPTAVFRKVTDALKRLCRNSESECSEGSDICWKIPLAKVDETLDNIPSFIITFDDGASVEWKARSYLYRAGSAGRWCAAFEANSDSTTILGSSFMKQKDVIFDRNNDLIGFACAACPQYKASERPGPPPLTHDTEGKMMISQQQPPPTSHEIFTALRPKGKFPTSSDAPTVLRRPTAVWFAVAVAACLVVGAMLCIACQTLTKRQYNYTYMPEHLTDDEEGTLELADLNEADDDDGPHWRAESRYADIQPYDDAGADSEEDDVSSANVTSAHISAGRRMGPAFSTSSQPPTAAAANSSSAASSGYYYQQHTPLPPPFAASTGGSALVGLIPVSTERDSSVSSNIFHVSGDEVSDNSTRIT